MSWQTDYVNRYYRSKPGWMDGSEEFHRLCGAYISETSRVLELGAGPDNPTSRFLSERAASLVGLDIDDAVKGNQYLAEAHVYDGTHFPFEDRVFDAVVSDYAFEHIVQPQVVCNEIARVLMAGGAFLFRTPNAFHYVSLLSRVMPDRVSLWARNRSEDHPVYPKFFRFNTGRRCRRTLARAGFEVLQLKWIEKEPSYGMASRLLFFPLMAYERIVNSSQLFRGMRANILCAARAQK